MRALSITCDSNNVFVGTDLDGVYGSSDNGGTWSHMNNGLPAIRVNSIVLKNNYVFAGTVQGGVFNSSNNGITWYQANRGLTNTSVAALGVCGNTIIAATGGQGTYTSTNGTDWVQSNYGQAQFDFSSLTVSGTNIFAGNSDGAGIYLSTNIGLTWSTVNNGISPNAIILSLASQDSNIYAGSSVINSAGSVYSSTNSGKSWSQYGLNSSVIALAVKADIILAGSVGSYDYGGVFRSTNHGLNWYKMSYWALNVTPTSFAVCGDKIFAGSVNNGVYYSTDDGVNWTHSGVGVPLVKVISLYAFENNIFASTSQGVYASKDYGTSWHQVNDGLPDINIASFIYFDNYIYVGTSGMGVWRRPLSEITGINQENANLPYQFFLEQNYPNPFNPNTEISYSIPSASNVKLIVYNTLGQTVRFLENSYKQVGNYSINFNASGLPSGIYFYKLEAGNFSQFKKMMLIK